MKKLLLLTFLFQITNVLSYAQNIGNCQELFFSEYVEGTKKNKALEIYNPTNDTINLKNYSIKVFAKGPTNPLVLPLTGTLLPKDVHVCGHPQAEATLVALCDITANNLRFTGSDAVGLYRNDILIDMIGEIGFAPNPNTGWQVGTGSTKDHTLRRGFDVRKGTTDWSVGVLTWEVFSKDDFSGLGSHQCRCALPTANFVSSASSFPESATGINLDIQLTGIDPDNFTTVWIKHNPFSVQCAAIDSMATSLCGDYITQTENVSWFPNEGGIKSIMIDFCDDVIDEKDEFICFELDEFLSSANIGTNKKHKMKIIDNDVTGIDDIDITNIRIYPSVAKETIFIKGIQDTRDVMISVHNVLGQELISLIPDINGTIKIDISKLEAGMYFLNLYDEDTVVIRKFIKE